MRIFVPTKRGLVFRLFQILVWLNVSFYVANVLSVIFQCTPVPKVWNTSMPGTCINTSLNFIITGVINVVSDVLIMLLPLWTIWHLKLPIQKKLSVSTVFAAGILYVIPTTFHREITDRSQRQLRRHHAPLLFRQAHSYLRSDLCTPAACHVDVRSLMHSPQNPPYFIC